MSWSTFLSFHQSPSPLSLIPIFQLSFFFLVMDPLLTPTCSSWLVSEMQRFYSSILFLSIIQLVWFKKTDLILSFYSSFQGRFFSDSAPAFQLEKYFQQIFFHTLQLFVCSTFLHYFPDFLIFLDYTSWLGVMLSLRVFTDTTGQI